MTTKCLFSRTSNQQPRPKYREFFLKPDPPGEWISLTNSFGTFFSGFALRSVIERRNLSIVPNTNIPSLAIGHMAIIVIEIKLLATTHITPHYTRH